MAGKGKERIKKGAMNPLIPLLIVVAVLAGIAFVLTKLHEREKPQLSIMDDYSRFGMQKTIEFSATDAKSGIRSITAFLSQGDKKVKIYEKTVTRRGFLIDQGPEKIVDSIDVQTKDLGFDQGRADLQFMIRDFSWWGWMEGNEISLSYPTIIDTSEPRIVIQSSPRYIKPGGAGVVVYKANEEITDHGVTVNGHFFPGFPLSANGQQKYVAYLAVPFNTEKFEGIQINAKDRAGNPGLATFGMILRKTPMKIDRINISDSFLQAKLPEFSLRYPELTGSEIEKYLYINSEIRARNYQTIQEFCGSPHPERLWQGRFSRLSRSSRRSGFAEHRTYYYKERMIDRQYHLGIDLASVRQAGVEAANRGKVVFAEYLGIYGNTVILDHGQGLFSLYSHMSGISVNLGDIVEKDAVIGHTGTTGLAGGDHLHFSMLVNGIFVDPLEWWDDHWLRVNILNTI